jgi:predicted nucleic acid-binding protein
MAAPPVIDPWLTSQRRVAMVTVLKRAGGDSGRISEQVPLEHGRSCRRRRYPVSYADAFSVALARRNHGRVMTGDPEFKAVESEVRVRWLPDRRR